MAHRFLCFTPLDTSRGLPLHRDLNAYQWVSGYDGGGRVTAPGGGTWLATPNEHLWIAKDGSGRVAYAEVMEVLPGTQHVPGRRVQDVNIGDWIYPADDEPARLTEIHAKHGASMATLVAVGKRTGKRYAVRRRWTSLIQWAPEYDGRFAP